MDSAAVLAFVLVVVAAIAVEYGRTRLALRWLRRDVSDRGCELLRARWKGPAFRLSSHQAAFAVEVRCPDESRAASVIAYVGGWWLGPFFSTAVKYEWDDD
jgi:hypothetical protein